MTTQADIEFMSRAIELSKLGYPAPNPHVGCVIVQSGQIVGEGFHDYAGGPHAEIVALEQARDQAAGATVYTTLEPCNHQGRTGPCSDALINAGVSRVVIAAKDTHFLASGGAERLRKAGVEVVEGVEEKAAVEANFAWHYAMAHRRPYVVAKAAITLDGRIALPNGESKWITGESSRRKAHELRAECGAVLVGRGTVAADDPSLSVRHLEVRNQPQRIVLDQNRTLSADKKVFSDGQSTWRVVASKPTDGEIEVPHVNCVFDLNVLLAMLFERGITGLLVEGGAHTVSSFLEARLVNRLELFLAPKIFGDGPTWAYFSPPDSLQLASAWRFSEVRQLDSDLWLTAHPIA